MSVYLLTELDLAEEYVAQRAKDSVSRTMVATEAERLHGTFLNKDETF